MSASSRATGLEAKLGPRSACRVSCPALMACLAQVSALSCLAGVAHSRVATIQPTIGRVRATPIRVVGHGDVWHARVSCVEIVSPPCSVEWVCCLRWLIAERVPAEALRVLGRRVDRVLLRVELASASAASLGALAAAGAPQAQEDALADLLFALPEGPTRTSSAVPRARLRSCTSMRRGLMHCWPPLRLWVSHPR